MPTYRCQVRHVRYWRGQVHRWTTDYLYSGVWSGGPGDADAQSLLENDDNMCWGNALAANGGTFECSIYNLDTGGVPVAQYTAFDWETPGDWIAYNGEFWPVGTPAAFEGTAEVALLVEWPGGLSSTGKPVFFRKWYHAVPPVDPTGAAHQVSDTAIASLQDGANTIKNLFAGAGMLMQSQSGRIAGDSVVRPYYANHQMPRGRRLKTLVSSSLPSGDIRVVGPPLEA